MKGKACESSHYIISHRNIGVTEYLFNTSFTSWRYDWLLDTCATCQTKFQRVFFENFNDNVDAIVYFVDKSSFKSLIIGTIKLNFHGFSNFILIDSLYLP